MNARSILLALAVACFVLAVAGVGRVNLVALGLALWALAELVR